MPTRTVFQGFNDLLPKLTPTPTETAAATSHRTSIQQCLQANFGLEALFRSGSFGNGTSVYGYSDVDYFAVLPTKSLKRNSNSSLEEVRNALSRRFPASGVYLDCPAIGIPFGNGGSQAHEIVIADYVTTANQYRVFDIADGNGGWMHSSPDAHNAYVRSIDNRLSNKVKPLIRFVKYWKYLNNVEVSSFYLELRVAKFASDEQSIVYEYDLLNVFKLLLDNGLAAMQDPMGVSGYVNACNTLRRKEDALSKLNTAYNRVAYAIEENRKGNTESAFLWLNKLFDGNFPSYYYY